MASVSHLDLFRLCLFLFLFCFCLRLSFIYFFHYLWHYLSLSFTALITLRYYFISWETPCITSFTFIYCFYYLCAYYRHLLLSQLHFALTSSLYNRPCNRFYNNYVIDIWAMQLLWFIWMWLIFCTNQFTWKWS